MKVKKTVCALLLMLFFTATAFAGDCYSVWVGAMDDASEAYTTDMAKCRKYGWGSGVTKCGNEAKLSYGKSIDAAGQAYYDCIMK